MTNKNVILLHGALGCSTDLDGFAKQLMGEGLQPHQLEFSGHGKQPFASDFGIGRFSEELKSFIEDRGLKASAAFGYSMGGFVALHAATLHRGLLGPVVTLGTKLNWTAENIKQESGFCSWEFLSQKAPAFAAAIKSKHHDHLQLLERTASMIRGFESASLLDNGWQPEQKIFLGLGDRDKLVTVEECRDFIKGKKTCGMYMVPDTGHPFDQADHVLLAKMIKRMLERSWTTAGSATG